MRPFEEIFAIAAERKGGDRALEAMLTKPLSSEDLAIIGDDRWLSTMTKCLFQAGFNWNVIETKWQGFEEAFEGFNPNRIAHWHEEEIDKLLSNKAIVRNGAKITAAVKNAHFICQLSAEHGSVANFFAHWPSENYVDLLEYLKKNGARLGSATGQYFLRSMGKDSFILSRDVNARLIAEGIVTKPATSKRDLAATQEAFNMWSDQSGRSLTEISRVLAISIG